MIPNIAMTILLMFDICLELLSFFEKTKIRSLVIVEDKDWINPSSVEIPAAINPMITMIPV